MQQIYVDYVRLLNFVRCEFFVSAEQVQQPDIPYHPVSEPNMLPSNLVSEAIALTQRCTESLPLFRRPLHTILYQLHQLGLVYARESAGVDINSLVAGPLYDTEYALLEVLSSQRTAKYAVLDVEALLAATLQLYLWVGPRKMRPQVRLCSVLASRVALALSLFAPIPATQEEPASRKQPNPTSHVSLKNYSSHCHSRPPGINNLVAWSLALASIVGAAVPIPEHQWLMRYFTMHLKVMGLIDNIDGYRSLLSIFPNVDGFDWIDLEGLFHQVRKEEYE